MLVQSWLQVPYTEHSSKSAHREKDKKMGILAQHGCPETPPADRQNRLQFRNAQTHYPANTVLEFTGSCALTVI